MPELIRAKIRDIQDFPKPGIVFKDITTVLKDAEAFRRSINYLTDKFSSMDIDYVVGIESRGFIFGAPLAYNLNAGLVVVRKPGKLPAQTEKVSYELEYGTDTVEIHKDAIEPGKRVLLVDDLLATGGTAAATYNLIKKTGGNPIALAFIIELEFLEGRAKFPVEADIFSMVKY